MHNEEGVFDTPKTCDKIGVRVHNLYTNASDGTGYYWMKMDIRVNASSFDFSPVYFNATFTQNVQTILGDDNDAFSYSNADQTFNNWRFFSLNTSNHKHDAPDPLSIIVNNVNNIFNSNTSPRDQVFTARVGYDSPVLFPSMLYGSYSLCLTDVKCGEREDIMYKELVSKDGNITEYDPATHVHMHKAKVKYRCSPGSIMGNISEVDTECMWNKITHQVSLLFRFHLRNSAVL